MAELKAKKASSFCSFLPHFVANSGQSQAGTVYAPKTHRQRHSFLTSATPTAPNSIQNEGACKGKRKKGEPRAMVCATSMFAHYDTARANNPNYSSKLHIFSCKTFSVFSLQTWRHVSITFRRSCHIFFVFPPHLIACDPGPPYTYKPPPPFLEERGAKLHPGAIIVVNCCEFPAKREKRVSCTCFLWCHYFFSFAPV